MTDSIVWPSSGRAFAVLQQDEALEFDVEISVARSGRVYTYGLPGARWTTELTFPDDTVVNLAAVRQREALLASLRGGATRLELCNLLQPVPLGTLRGSPTVATTAAAGATSIAIAGATASPNLLQGGGFEIDTDSNGLADGWTSYVNGSVGAVAHASGVALSGVGARSQRNSVTALGTADLDRAGHYRDAVQPADVPVGPVTASAWALVNPGCNLKLQADFYSAGGSLLGSLGPQVLVGAGATQRIVVSGTPTAAPWRSVRLYLWATATGSPFTGNVWFDDAQVELGAVASAFAGSPTMLRGDRLRLGATGQRVMATADAAGSDAGAITVQFTPPLRASVASGTEVVWNRPASLYVPREPRVLMPARSTSLPGYSMGFVEAWE